MNLLNRYRPVFNWTHRIIGYVAHIFAFTAMFLAFGYRDMNLPQGLTIALIFYVSFYLFIHLILSIKMFYYSLNTGLVYDEEQSSKETSVNARDSQGSAARKIIIVFYAIFVWVFAIAFVVVIAEA